MEDRDITAKQAQTTDRPWTGGGGINLGSTPTPKRAHYGDECAASESPRLSLRSDLERRMRNMNETASGLFRMQQILNEHPEFEQFLELSSLVKRHGF